MSGWIQLTRLCRGVRPIALGWSVSAIAICVACSAGGPDEPSEHSNVEDELAEVVYQGNVTDEALLRLLDRTPQPQSQPQVSMCSLDAGASVTAQAPIEFSFTMSSCALVPNPSATRRSAAEPVLSVLLGALAPIGVAHAHGAPFNGTAYYLRVSDAQGVPTMQAFTDGTAYTPNQAQWTRMIESAQPLRLEIVWAEFDNNEVAGNGPFEAPAVSFQLQK